jgi:Sulfatase
VTFRRESVRDVLIALSLANLHFLAAWSGLLATRNLIFRSTVLVDATAVTLCVLGLAAVLFVAMRLARRLRPRVNGLQHLFLLALVVPIDWARMEVPALVRVFWLQRLGTAGNVVWAALMLVIGVCAAAVYMRNPDRVRHALQWGALVLSPLLPICLVQALYLERSLEVSPTGPVLHQNGGQPRVMWLLFDEMDFPIAFTHRPVGFALSNLDRLRDEALFATAARSPSKETQLSVPSLLGGRRVSAFVPISARDALLRYSDSTTDGQRRPAGDTVHWRSTETVFDWVRALGFNAGVAGTGFLPYCRAFSTRLTRCENTAAPRRVGIMVVFTLLSHPALSHDVFGSSQRIKTLKATVLRSMLLADHLKVFDVARRFAADSSLGYVFAHFTLPHPPYVSGRPLSYYGNLMLADSLFGVVRHSMERAGTWDRTTIVITSDHGLRHRVLLAPELAHLEEELLGTIGARIPNPGATRVPFFIKLGGKRDHLRYDRPFGTVLLAELTLKLLRRDLNTAKEVAAWIDAQRQALPNDVHPDKGPPTETAAAAQP